MKTLNETLENLNKSDRVKIMLPSGAYLQGRKKKVQKDLHWLINDLKVNRTEISFIAIPYRVNLCKEVVIYAS